MSRGNHLGEFEQLVLLALARLGRTGYGMTVRREIESTCGREVSIGSVYATLERLTSKGYLSSWHSEPEARRGGKARRNFRLETTGVRALAHSRDTFSRMWEGVVLDPEAGT